MSDARPKIFLTRELPPACMERLRAESVLTSNPDDRVLSKDELLRGVRGQDGLVCLLTDAIDAAVLDANPQLRVVANFAVGFNNIDVEAATARRIPVTNTPGVLTESTADLAWALIFATMRRVVEGDAFVRSRKWSGWGPLQYLGADVAAATIGLVGMGRIGRAMIPRAHGFGMNVLYWNRTRLAADEELQLGISYGEFDDVLAASDVVSLHVALNDGTHHLMSKPQFDRMKRSAFLINTTRGPVVDERALVAALRSGAIAGAGLDVFENEPALEPGLYDLPNAVLLPHLGSATIGTRTKMGMMAIDNCLVACRGDRPPNLVNPAVYR